MGMWQFESQGVARHYEWADVDESGEYWGVSDE